MGLSSHPEAGYEKVAQARDLAIITDQLGFQEVALVTHDIGNMVGYAFAALFPKRVTKWVVMDAPQWALRRSFRDESVSVMKGEVVSSILTGSAIPFRSQDCSSSENGSFVLVRLRQRSAKNVWPGRAVQDGRQGSWPRRARDAARAC